MSFILDALKKSETDRQRQASPALFEVKVAAPRHRLPPWAIGLAVLLGVNALVLGWFLLRPSATPETARAESPAGSPANLAASATPPPPATQSPQAAGTMMTLPATVTVTIPSSPGVNVATHPGPGIVAPSVEPPLVEEPFLSGSEPAVPPDYDVRDYQPAITASEAGAIAQDSGGVPSRDEVLARGASLPELRLDLHVYHEDPASRFVFINMRKLREGESLPDGVRVEEITRRGARLSYRGTQFALDGN